jgi:ABC-type lipoprotein release transport system permease subunit
MKRIMEISFLVLAFRNLGRHKAKTVLTTISVSLTVFLFVALESYNLGTILDIKRYMLLYESGAAMISAKTDHENKKEEPLREGIQDYRNLVSELERAGFRAAPRARVSGMLSGKEDPLPLTLIAIDPDREKAVFRNHAYVVKGEFVREGRSDIVIGRTLALDLGVDVGDTVFFTAPLTKEDSRGGIVRFTQRIALRVGGILNTPNVTVNTGLGYVALEAMQGEEGLILDGRVTEICLRDAKATERDLVLETESPANVRRRLSGILPDTLMVTGWDEGAKEFLALADGLRLATFVTLPVFLVLGLLGIGNTMASPSSSGAGKSGCYAPWACTIPR